MALHIIIDTENLEPWNSGISEYYNLQFLFISLQNFYKFLEMYPTSSFFLENFGKPDNFLFISFRDKRHLGSVQVALLIIIDTENMEPWNSGISEYYNLQFIFSKFLKMHPTSSFIWKI